MLKTFKTVKKMRFDELLTYFWNEVGVGSPRNYIGFSPIGTEIRVHITRNGHIQISGSIDEDVRFPIEVEEEITNYTNLDEVVRVREIDYGISVSVFKDASIKYLLDMDKSLGYRTLQISTLIDGKMETVWERDEE